MLAAMVTKERALKCMALMTNPCAAAAAIV